MDLRHCFPQRKPDPSRLLTRFLELMIRSHTTKKNPSGFIQISPFPPLKSLLSLQCFLSVIMNICDSGGAKINPIKEILCSYAKQVLFTGLSFVLKGVQCLPTLASCVIIHITESNVNNTKGLPCS